MTSAVVCLTIMADMFTEGLLLHLEGRGKHRLVAQEGTVQRGVAAAIFSPSLLSMMSMQLDTFDHSKLGGCVRLTTLIVRLFTEV